MTSTEKHPYRALLVSGLALILALALAIAYAPPILAEPGPGSGGGGGGGSSSAGLTITRAEARGLQLRVEGEGAAPNTAVSSPDAATEQADDRGRFRLEGNDFRSATCQVTVFNGASSATASIEGCVPVASTTIFAGLEAELADPLEPLGVPGTTHPSPTNGGPALPVADLPPGSVLAMTIEGVLTSMGGGEWGVGTQPIRVYASADGTRVDDNPQLGDLVRVRTVRTIEMGPIIAERIEQRAAGPQPAGPAAAEEELLFSGTVLAIDGDVFNIGGFLFNFPPEGVVDVGEGDEAIVAFLPPAG